MLASLAPYWPVNGYRGSFSRYAMTADAGAVLVPAWPDSHARTSLGESEFEPAVTDVDSHCADAAAVDQLGGWRPESVDPFSGLVTRFIQDAIAWQLGVPAAGDAG
jgi:hypothetical protein